MAHVIQTDQAGPLFKVLWYRVVLDEAHMIRNQTTRAAKAAFDLNSIYRWCLTGTPVMNSLGDLYPILHFLNISPQADLKEFRAHISKVERKRPRLAANRMQVRPPILWVMWETTDHSGDLEDLLDQTKQGLDFEWRPSLESTSENHLVGRA